MLSPTKTFLWIQILHCASWVEARQMEQIVLTGWIHKILNTIAVRVLLSQSQHIKFFYDRTAECGPTICRKCFTLVKCDKNIWKALSWFPPSCERFQYIRDPGKWGPYQIITCCPHPRLQNLTPSLTNKKTKTMTKTKTMATPITCSKTWHPLIATEINLLAALIISLGTFHN